MGIESARIEQLAIAQCEKGAVTARGGPEIAGHFRIQTVNSGYLPADHQLLKVASS
jgi:hypothetical protein